MKKIILLCTLMTFGLTSSWAYSPISGHYESLSSHQIFQISDSHRGIVVKGKYDRTGTFFRKKHHGSYKSKKGDKLTIRKHGEVELKKRGHRSIILQRINHRDHRKYDGRREYRSGQHDWDRHFDNRLHITGRWHEDNHHRKHQDIIIEELPRGISVSMNHCHDEFYKLVRSWDRVNIFENKRGDTFSHFRNGDLVWTSANGHREKYYHRY